MNKHTCQKSETQFFSHRCQEEDAVLMVLFSLFLEGVEPNLLRHVCVKKPSHFPNMLNFCLFLNIKSFSGIIKLPKNV